MDTATRQAMAPGVDYSTGDGSHVQEREANSQETSHEVPKLATENAEGERQGHKGEEEMIALSDLQ